VVYSVVALCIPDIKTVGVLTIVVDTSVLSTTLATSNISSLTLQVYLYEPLRAKSRPLY
jgi:hypothetical protein